MASGPGHSVRPLLEEFTLPDRPAYAGVVPNPTIFALELPGQNQGVQGNGSPTLPAAQNYPGRCVRFLGDDWFGLIHIVPRRFDFGNILGTIARNIDIFNAFIDTPVTWSSFVNNVGQGLSITNLPSLPTVIQGLNGITLDLEVTTVGSPQFDTTLDFVFNTGTILIPVTGSRVIMFPYPPETELIERMGFLTDVIAHQDGSEQRISLRKNPRQEFQFRLIRDAGAERSRIDFLFFDWQGRVVGLPMWHESTFTTSAISASDTVINVGSTDNADYRVNGLAIILGDDEFTFDALEIDSLTSTTITFKTGTANAYRSGVQVMPIRTAILDQTFTGTRHKVALGEFDIRFRILDNDSNLADTTGWSMFDGAVLLDDFNFVTGSAVKESWEMKLIELDNQTGSFGHQTPWDRNKHASVKGFKTSSRADLWKLRKLLHAFRGRQVSFWLPTFFAEFTLVGDLNSGNSTINIENVGYNRFVRNRDGKNIIRVTQTNGTILTREITGSSEISASEEQLTVDTAWGSTILKEDVLRIDFYEKVRMDTDRLEIRHQNNLGDALLSFPVKQVFE